MFRLETISLLFYYQSQLVWTDLPLPPTVHLMSTFPVTLKVKSAGCFSAAPSTHADILYFPSSVICMQVVQQEHLESFPEVSVLIFLIENLVPYFTMCPLIAHAKSLSEKKNSRKKAFFFH